MTRQNDQKRANEMYDLYLTGKSLSEVANEYEITRQCVYDIFKYRNFKLRTQNKRPFQYFNGKKYTLANTGYYRSTTGKRNLMHRDVWEYHNGKIPDGWDIHHVDENKANNDISNLKCLSKSEHTKLYSPHHNQYTKRRKTAYANA